MRWLSTLRAACPPLKPSPEKGALDVARPWEKRGETSLSTNSDGTGKLIIVVPFLSSPLPVETEDTM